MLWLCTWRFSRSSQAIATVTWHAAGPIALANFHKPQTSTFRRRFTLTPGDLKVEGAAKVVTHGSPNL
jgi:hypothetical protein